MKIYWIDLNQFDTKTDKATFLEVCNQLVQNDYEVCLVTSYKKDQIIPPHFKGEMKYIYSPSLPLFFRIILIMRIIQQLTKEIKRGDLIIIQPAALAISRWAHAKGANVHLDFRTLPCDIISLKGELDRLIYWRLSIKLFLRQVDSFSFITESLKREIEKEFRCQFDDYAIWTSAVNTEMFSIAPGGDDSPASKTIQLFYHGHMTKKRGIPTLIRAMADVVKDERTDVMLRLVGSGVELDDIKQIAEAAGMQQYIQFTGLQAYESMPKLISMADICISPLPDRVEWNVSSPLKVFEYLACGKPVIVTPIPAHREVLGEMAGIIYAKDDGEKALTEAIIEACRNIPSLKSKSEDLRQFVLKKYTWQHQAKSLIDYLRRNYKS